jgi:ElaB/YqjD/DUF883 family membrane-anchored ribosome-binding protein
MNDQRLEKKIQHDTAEIRKDLSMVMENSVSNVTEGFENMKNSTKESVSSTAESVKKDVKHSLGQYNAKAQDYAGKVSKGFSNTVTKYPWVAITIGLGIGLLLGGLLKPSRSA